LRDPISLDDLDIGQAEIACSSSLGGFWVYDSDNQQLMYFNRNLQKEQTSVPLGTVVNLSEYPSYMLEKNNFVYVYLEEIGILIFDRFGAFYKKVPVECASGFQIQNKFIVYFSDPCIIRYQPDLFLTDSIELPEPNLLNARIENQYLYIQKKDSVTLYNK